MCPRTLTNNLTFICYNSLELLSFTIRNLTQNWRWQCYHYWKRLSYYDPVYGITLHVPGDSLPQHVEKGDMTIKVGFNEHQLDSDTIICSATVALHLIPKYCSPRNLFLEISHSFSSMDTSDLRFVKFSINRDNM